MFQDVYKPFEERTPDSQYQDCMRLTLETGERLPTPQGTDALTLPHSYTMRYLLSNGAPVITARKIPFWRKSIGEIMALSRGKRTLEQLEEYGCRNFWEDSATPEKCLKRGLEPGDLGPGSYGVAFHDFPMPGGGTFNQFEAVIAQIKYKPLLRTHFVSPWIPYLNFRTETLIQKVVTSPCHGWVRFRVLGTRLVLQMVQRSGDLPVGVPSNKAQYTALLLMVAKDTNLVPWMFEHIILDPHIYVDQIDKVKELIERKPGRLPTMTINDDAADKDFWTLMPSDFSLTDYGDAHPAMPDIPVSP